MNQDQLLNLVPQVVLDIADSVKTNKNKFVRDNYIMRLEAIVEFCNKELERERQNDKDHSATR